MLLFVSCSSDSSNSTESLVDNLQKMINNEISEEVPGVQLSVYSPETGQIDLSAGKANLDTDEKLTPGHKLRIASITKLFTATLIMKMVEENILSLDDNLSELLPELEFENNHLIKVENLLNHTSDLMGYFNDDYDFQDFVLDNPENVYLPEELVLKAVSLHTPQPENISQNFHYCNTNYVLLGMIIEKYSGKSFSEYLVENICQPLNLSLTQSADLTADIFKMSKGYSFLDNQILSYDYNHSFLFSAGNIVSNTSDLVKFVYNLFHGNVISLNTISEMLPPENSIYGLGIADFTGLGKGHNGMTLGFTTILIYNEQYDVSIAVLTNCLSGSVDPQGIAEQALDLFIGKQHKE